MSKWQPIETAPRDGTVVDLWVSHRLIKYRLTDCSWDLDGWIDCTLMPIRAGETPAHWMPLPEPPA